MKIIFTIIFIIILIFQGLYWYDYISYNFICPLGIEIYFFPELYMFLFFFIALAFFMTSIISKPAKCKICSYLFTNTFFLFFLIISLSLNIFGYLNTITFSKTNFYKSLNSKIYEYDNIEKITIKRTKFPLIDKAVFNFKNKEKFLVFGCFYLCNKIFEYKCGLFLSINSSLIKVYEELSSNLKTNKKSKEKSKFSKIKFPTKRELMKFLCNIEEFTAKKLIKMRAHKDIITPKFNKLLENESASNRMAILVSNGTNLKTEKQREEFIYLLFCNSFESFNEINNDYIKRKNKSYIKDYDKVKKFICKKYDKFPLEKCYCNKTDEFIYPGKEIAILVENFKTSYYTYKAVQRSAKLINFNSLDIHYPLYKVIKKWYNEQDGVFTASASRF